VRWPDAPLRTGGPSASLARVRRATAIGHAAVTSRPGRGYLSVVLFPLRAPPSLHTAITTAAGTLQRRSLSPLTNHSTSSLDPSAPPGVACCPKPAPSSPETEPPRTSPPAAAVRRCGGPPRPNRVYLSILGEPTLDPELFPGQERRRSRRISGEPAASPAKDPIAGLEILAGYFL
jgi:hypothetical protein